MEGKIINLFKREVSYEEFKASEDAKILSKKQEHCTHQWEFFEKEDLLVCEHCGKRYNSFEFMKEWVHKRLVGNINSEYSLRNNIFFLEKEKESLEGDIKYLKLERRRLNSEIKKLKNDSTGEISAD